MCISEVHAHVLTQPRRGITTPALLVTLAVAMLLAVAALDIAQLSHQRQQLQNGADAAALAATSQVMDRRWLYRGVEGANTNDSELFDDVQFYQLRCAENDAICFAGENKIANRSIKLTESADNFINDDVVFGYVDDPAYEELEFDADNVPLAGADGSFNTVVVNASRRKAVGDLPLLWMARQVGLHQLEMVVTSQAAVDQRIKGFLPLQLLNADGTPSEITRVAVPMLPFAVVPQVEDYEDLANADDCLPTHLWWSTGPHDYYTVNEKLQVVTGCKDAPQPDGIAEMVLRIKSHCTDESQNTVKTRRGALIGFPLNDNPATTAPEAIAEVSLYGLELQDLPNGLIIEHPNTPPSLPAVYNDEPDDLEQICTALLTSNPPILGLPRIFPVVDEGDGGETVLLGFVAGTIVHCELDLGDKSLLLVVQPCLLQTPTAVVGDGAPRNPWIGKLLLNR